MMFAGLEEKWIYNSDFQSSLHNPLKKNLLKFTNDYFACDDSAPIGDLFINIPKKDFLKVPDMQFENFKKFIRLGGNIAMGTDSALGFTLHETPIWELKLLHSAGLSIEKTISAATYQSAKVFGKENELGSLSIGKKADIIIINGDLFADISNIVNICAIIVDGKFIKRTDL